MTEHSLTAAEAAGRSALLSVEHYDVELDLAGLAETDGFESRTTVDFSCAEPGATTWMDLIAQQVLRVELNGEALDRDTIVSGSRVTLPGLRADNRVVVHARHRESGRNHGLRRSVDDTDGAVYAWTHFEPFHAHRVFACFDQPDLKATFDLAVRAPSAWHCVSNGPAESIGEHGDARDWRFGTTPRLPTYVIALCAGPFHRVTDTRDGVELGVYARRSLGPHLERQAPAVLDVAGRALGYFGDAYGVAYPARKLDQVYVPDFPSAMENFGCITYGDAALFRDDPTPAQRQRRGQVQLHEIAHMWFGDLVTMPWWDGLWLKEAFATMAASMAAPTVLGAADVWTTFALGAEVGAYAADESPATHPVQVTVPDAATAASAFDAITYNKGLAVLRQLVAVIGEPTFLAGMRRYFARYTGGTADLGELLAELEAASGLDLRAWADEWVREPGADRLTLRVEARGTAAARLRVDVVAPGGGRSRSHRVAIGHYRHGTGGLQRVARVELDTNGGSAELACPEPVGDDDLLLLNDDDLTYGRVRLDDVSLRQLLASGHTLPTALSRAVGLGIVRGMLADAELDPAAAAAATLGSLRAERDVSLVSTLLAAARETIDWYAPDAEVARLEADLADACLDSLHGEEPGSQRWLTLALGAAACAGVRRRDAIDELLADDPSRHRELRWTALTRWVATDQAGDDAVADELHRDSDPDGPARAATARAARGGEEAKQRAVDVLFDGRTIPVAALTGFGDALWQRHQDELLRPYAAAYVDRLRTASATLGAESAARMVTSAFPRAGIDHALLDRADAFAGHPATPDPLASALRVQTHKLRRALGGRLS